MLAFRGVAGTATATATGISVHHGSALLLQTTKSYLHRAVVTYKYRYICSN